MKVFHPVIFLVLLAPAAALGQGVRMSADFLPLEVGNRWIYDIFNEEGVRLGQVDFAVQEHTIISGRSFYVLSRFPFVEAGGDRTTLLRYDRVERQFTRMLNDEESALFFADGASAEVLESDASGLPSKFVLHTYDMSLTFQRGVGIVEAQIETRNGPQTLKIASVGAGEPRLAEAEAAGVPVAPPPAPPGERSAGLVDNITTITEENPLLNVQAVAVPEGYKFVLTVTNTSDKLLPFHFDSGQSYDFEVVDPNTGTEVWKWSRRMFFTQVVRSEAIPSRRSWTFEAVWNGRDNNLDPVPPGEYQLVGIVAAQPLVESGPVLFEVR